MVNNPNAEFAKTEDSNLDVQNYWKYDFKFLKKIPYILCAKTFEISENNLKRSVVSSASEAAIMLFKCSIRSCIGLALAEIIIEDYLRKVATGATMYSIELENSKTFFDTWILRDYLENALESTNSREECIKYLKGIFTPIYEREKKHLIRTEECY